MEAFFRPACPLGVTVDHVLILFKRDVCFHSRVNHLWAGYKDTDLFLSKKNHSSSLLFLSHPLPPLITITIMLFKSIVSLACIAVAAAQATKGKSFDHIFIVFLENTVSWK